MEKLEVSVSQAFVIDNKKFAYVLFSDGERSAEGKIPDCKITSNNGFEEGEVLQLELYMKEELATLKKAASSVNLINAFMKDEKSNL